MRGDWAEWGRSRALRWIAAIGLSLIAVLVIWREPISQRLFPDPRMNRQLELAQAALHRGELSRADGGGARELYESVLAIDPDQMAAREGLAQVRDAAVARAIAALENRRITQARSDLALAQALSAPAVQLQPLLARLHDLDEASGNIPGLLAQASQPGVSDQAAADLYDRVLELDADNALALEGRRNLLASWLRQAQTLLANDRVIEAQQKVDAVIARDPAHLDLPPVQAQLGEAIARWQKRQTDILDKAQADERAGRTERAAGKYLQLQQSNPDSTPAREGLLRLATQWAVRAERQAADFHFTRAQAMLDKARTWSPEAPAIADAERNIAQSRAAKKRLGPTPARGDRQRLPALIAEANQAMEQGQFITPPGVSAWDRLRAASAIAPRSPELRRAQIAFGQRTQACFEQAMTDGQLSKAQSCLEARLTLDPLAASAHEARHRLAERWLAYAEERIAASDYPEANRALAYARRWEPNHPRIDAIAKRLRQAKGTVR